MDRQRRNMLIVLSLSIVVVVALILGVPIIRQSILPAEEGMNAGIYGFSEGIYDDIYSAKNPPSEPWQLLNDDPHNYMFGYWHDYRVHLWTGTERTDIRIECSQPYHEHYKEIQYWVEKDNEEILVKGDIWIYHLDLTFSVINKQAPGVYVYQDVPVWMALVTTVWDRTILDPTSGKQGTVWGAPISVYIESWAVDETGKGVHYKIEPSYEGRFITLYDEPRTAGSTIDDLGIDRGAVNQTLWSQHEDAPDSRMRGTAYMRFVLEDFGITTYYSLLGSLTGRDFPTVRYNLKVYYLKLGTWTFTKDQAEDWEEREGEEDRPRDAWDLAGRFNDLLAGVSAWWANMTWWDRLSFFGLTGLAAGLLLVLILASTGVLTWIIAYLLTRGKTKKKSAKRQKKK